MFDLFIIAKRESIVEITKDIKNLTGLPTLNILDVVEVVNQVKSKIPNFPKPDQGLSKKARSLILRKERKLYSKIFKKLKFITSNQEFKVYFEEKEILNNRYV